MSMSSSSSSKLVVSYDNATYEFDDSQLPTRTYADLKQLMSDTVGEQVDECVFLDENNNELSDNSSISVRSVSLANVNVTLSITDRGNSTDITISKYKPVKQLKQEYMIQTGQPLMGQLSLFGNPVGDHTRLVDLHVEDHSTFSGLLRVIIKDNGADKEAIIEVHDYDTIGVVRDQFVLSQRRKLVAESKFKQSPDDETEPLEFDKTIYSYNIFDNTTLYLFTPSFKLRFREHKSAERLAAAAAALGPDAKEEEPEILVHDWFTVRKVKEEFNVHASQTIEILTVADKLVYNDEELDDNYELYKYGIVQPTRDDSTVDVFIAREDVTQVAYDYVCSNCGNDVRLKKMDHVRCLDCGQRILFKKRTPKPCQYNTR